MTRPARTERTRGHLRLVAPLPDLRPRPTRHDLGYTLRYQDGDYSHYALRDRPELTVISWADGHTTVSCEYQGQPVSPTHPLCAQVARDFGFRRYQVWELLPAVWAIYPVADEDDDTAG